MTRKRKTILILGLFTLLSLASVFSVRAAFYGTPQLEAAPAAEPEAAQPAPKRQQPKRVPKAQRKNR